MQKYVLLLSLFFLSLILSDCNCGDHHDPPPIDSTVIVEGIRPVSRMPAPAQPEPTAAARGYVDAFRNTNPADRFALSYTLDRLQPYWRPVGDTQVAAIRLFNSFEDPAGNTRFYSIHSMYSVNPDTLCLIPSAQKYWMNDQCNDPCPYDGRSPIQEASASKSPDELKRSSEMYREFVPALDPIYSFTLLRSEYNQTIASTPGAVTLRIYHGVKNNERVLVLVGADATGRAIWPKNVLVASARHLCPNECDRL